MSSKERLDLLCFWRSRQIHTPPSASLQQILTAPLTLLCFLLPKCHQESLQRDYSWRKLHSIWRPWSLSTCTESGWCVVFHLLVDLVLRLASHPHARELQECDPFRFLAHPGSSKMGEGHQEHHRGPGPRCLQYCCWEVLHKGILLSWPFLMPPPGAAGLCSLSLPK